MIISCKNASELKKHDYLWYYSLITGVWVVVICSSDRNIGAPW